MNRFTLILLAICLFQSSSFSAQSPKQNEGESEYGIAIDALDTNGDGKVEPYEAADAIQQINLDAESKEGLTIIEMEKQFELWEKEDVAEVLEEFDENENGALEKEELNSEPELKAHFESCDSNEDGKLRGYEVIELFFGFEDSEEALLDEQSSMEVVEDVFEDFDVNQDGRLSSQEWLTLDYSEMEDEAFTAREFLLADRNHSGSIDSRELQKYFLAIEGPVEFEVQDKIAHMSGIIDSSLPAKVIELIVEHPDVRTIQMGIVPGSMDDDANLRASLLIHRHRFQTIVAQNGWIASGGVDFFLAGHKRVVQDGGQLGVHSWADEDGAGSDRPNDSADHRSYLDFYSSIGVDKSFYWYTLKVATPDEVHWLSEQEIQKFGVVHSAAKNKESNLKQDGLRRSEVAGFKIEALTDRESKAMRTVFEKRVVVFGVPIFATKKTLDRKIRHAASVLAEYLDNDRDGNPDNPLVVQSLKKHHGAILMFATERESERAERQLMRGDFKWNPVALYGEETHPGGAANGVFDASLEEIIHLITSVGFANAYPDAFGEKPGTRIANAMDKARGGRFKQVPKQYPKGAWYTYDDTTCEYGCMVTEYIYWGLTSVLGGQEFPGRLEEIQHEWKLNTRQKVKDNDPELYKLLTDPRFKFPTKLPQGDYQVKS